MKLTIYTTDEQCLDLGQFKIAHMTMFGKGVIELHFISKEEQIRLLQLFIEKYVLFQVQGTKVSIIPESNNYQRVGFRFDNDYVPLKPH